MRAEDTNGDRLAGDRVVTLAVGDLGSGEIGEDAAVGGVGGAGDGDTETLTSPQVDRTAGEDLVAHGSGDRAAGVDTGRAGDRPIDTRRQVVRHGHVEGITGTVVAD